MIRFIINYLKENYQVLNLDEGNAFYEDIIIVIAFNMLSIKLYLKEIF